MQVHFISFFNLISILWRIDTFAFQTFLSDAPLFIFCLSPPGFPIAIGTGVIHIEPFQGSGFYSNLIILSNPNRGYKPRHPLTQ